MGIHHVSRVFCFFLDQLFTIRLPLSPWRCGWTSSVFYTDHFTNRTCYLGLPVRDRPVAADSALQDHRHWAEHIPGLCILDVPQQLDGQERP